MLEYYVKSQARLALLRGKPLAEHIDGLATHLYGEGFTQLTGQRILGLTGKLNEFAFGLGVEKAEEVDDSLVKRFLVEDLRIGGVFRDAESLLRHVTDYLRERGVIASVTLSCAEPEDRFAVLLEGYLSHLVEVRGLRPSTCQACLRYARLLLEWYQKRHGERELTSISGVDVLDFIQESADLHSSGGWRNNLCSLTRSFLRYLRWEGVIDLDLARAVPRVPHWRLQSIPRHIPWDQVRALIDSVDTSTPVGLRDKAVLLCIATLGIRSKEVRTLRLGDIRWRAGEIRLAHTKSRRDRGLPLLPEVGAALADYVLHGRGRLDLPQVFLTHRAPRRAIASSGGIVGIVRKHLERAGIRAPSHGAHVLRHSLATRMVNQGVPIKQVADLLGHASIDTTAIYTKVDLESLSAVALPFPGSDA